MTIPRPKDAATLILVRHRAGIPQILMGQRSSRHAFMPDKYVFPGGKVDRCDRFISAASELSPNNHDALLSHNSGRQPRAFAMAAVRETWEETGLLVGQQGDMRLRSTDANWHRYGAMGVIPSLKHLHFIARAITPPMRSKRFDARFFMADADTVLLDDRPPEDGAEMADLRWFTYDAAMALDIPTVTRFILGELAARLREPDLPHRPAFLRWNRGKHQLTRL